jgi:hypothetical protein
MSVWREGQVGPLNKGRGGSATACRASSNPKGRAKAAKAGATWGTWKGLHDVSAFVAARPRAPCERPWCP